MCVNCRTRTTTETTRTTCFLLIHLFSGLYREPEPGGGSSYSEGVWRIWASAWTFFWFCKLGAYVIRTDNFTWCSRLVCVPSLPANNRERKCCGYGQDTFWPVRAVEGSSDAGKPAPGGPPTTGWKAGTRSSPQRAKQCSLQTARGLDVRCPGRWQQGHHSKLLCVLYTGLFSWEVCCGRIRIS